MNRVAVFGRNFNEGFKDSIFDFFEIIKAYNIKVSLFEPYYKFIKEFCDFDPEPEVLFNTCDDISEDTDLMFSIGGDGTFLESVSFIKDKGIPIVGINAGRLGFLTAVADESGSMVVDHIQRGDYVMEPRTMVGATFRSDDDRETLLEGLNEIAIDERVFARRAVTLHLSINGSDLGSITADGVIVSSPTGSTAYALSAGGPITHPRVPALLLQPVNPHALAIRPLVFPADEVVTVTSVDNRASLKVTADGQQVINAAPGTPVRIATSARQARLAFLPHRSYYDVLRTKLNWGGTPKDR